MEFVVGGGVDDVMMRTIEQNISTLYSELLPLFVISNSSFHLPPSRVWRSRMAVRQLQCHVARVEVSSASSSSTKKEFDQGVF